MHTVVGGPPNSGKSTVTAALVELCRDRRREQGYNPTFAWSTLDISDTSLPAMLADGSRSASRDVSWTETRAEERAVMFGSRDEQLVVADCPGLIDDKTTMVVEPADSMILVASDQKQTAAEEWVEFATDNGLELFADLTTTLDSDKQPRWTDRESRDAIVRSVHNREFDERGVESYDDTTRRILKQLALDLFRESESR